MVIITILIAKIYFPESLNPSEVPSLPRSYSYRRRNEEDMLDFQDEDDGDEDDELNLHNHSNSEEDDQDVLLLGKDATSSSRQRSKR